MKPIRYTLLLSLLAIAQLSQAQIIIQESLPSVHLSDVVISVNKQAESKNDVAQEVKVLTQKEIEEAQALNTADLLATQGIAVQKSQLGGGSPVLRGFEASRILLMIDGVRMNNLIYRAGHLQDIIKTDMSSFERIEVLYGPASTIYGSDALGGVIHLYTQKPEFATGNKTSLSFNASSRYESACKGNTQHVSMNIGGKNWASLTSFTYSFFNDLMSGKNQNPCYTSEYGTRPYYASYLGNGKDTLLKNDNRNLQVGTGYVQTDVMQKFIYRQNEKLTHSINIQYSTTNDVPRYDRLTDPSSSTGLKSAEWYYGPQKRMLTAYDMNMKNPICFADDLHLGVNYQSLEESRHNRSFNSKFRNNRIENVSVVGLNLDLVKHLYKHELRYGLDIALNNLKSTADKLNIVDGTSAALDTRYPDGNNKMNYYGAYISHSWKINNQLTLVDGFRLGYTTLHSTLVDTALMFHLPYTDIEQKTPVYSGNIGIINMPSDNWKLSFLVSTGYRVPNVDDMSKIFGSATGMVIVPNKDLKPEQTINYEMGITHIFNQNTRWENSIYYTDYRNIAVVDTFRLNGKDSLMYDGSMSRVFANQNKDKAYIYGLSSNFVTRIDQHFTWSLHVNYTYGRIKTDSSDAPLDHIPPFMARTALKYNNNKFSSEFFVIYNSWKKLKNYYLNGEDNEQYATIEGMPAWFTLNMRFSYKLCSNFRIQAGVDNIFDTQYRTFASGINAPGRNFIIALHLTAKK